MRVLRLLLACTFCSLTLPLTAAGAVQLPNVFSDHAVLQRDRPVRIWGWGQAGENVTVHFHGQTVSAQTDPSGYWEVWLKPESAGGPYSLTVNGDATATPLERKDILVGDVWLASGQSNMEFPLAGFTGTIPAPLKDGEKEIATANHPRIRLLVQKKATSTVPLGDGSDPWTECTPETARHFSAVAYFFGREISERENVPVGLIDTTWGGTPAHSWISPAALASLISLRSLKMRERSPRNRGGPTRSGPITHAKMPLCRQQERRRPPTHASLTTTAEPGHPEPYSTP
jgi:sialate O-acetylesterase